MIFTGSHDANAVAVANKRVDAATIADRIFDAAVPKSLVNREDIHVVWSSDPIPELPTVWRKNLSPDLKAKIKAAFLDIKDITWADQGKLNRFVETNDAAYDVDPRYRQGAQSRPQEDEMSRCTNAPYQSSGIGRPDDQDRGLKKSYGGKPVLHGIDLDGEVRRVPRRPRPQRRRKVDAASLH